MEYLLLFIVSFFSATLLPMGSEALLLFYSDGQISQINLILLWLVASVGNTIGACVNWLLGGYIERFREARWFPCSVQQFDRAKKYFSKYGFISLLFAWLPIIGDPLTFVAGALKMPFTLFLILVFIGKATRYFFLLYLVT